MAKFNFFDKFVVETYGDSEIINWIKKYYKKFTRSDIESPDLIVSPLRDSVRPEIIKGDSDNYYGVSDGQFVIKRRDNCVTINPDWSQIQVTESTNPYFLTDLIEFLLRKQMVEDGYALVHASAAVVNDETYVFPAWRHTGKTNTLITLLQESNASYMADDRVWINVDGTVLGYHLPINMYPYNYDAFRGLSHPRFSQRMRTFLSGKIEENIQFDRSPIDKALYFVNKYYVENESGQLRYLDDMIPSASFEKQSSLDHLIMLQTDMSIDGVQITPANNSEKVIHDIAATSTYEWNASLSEFCRVYNCLLGEVDMVQKLNHVIEKENEVLSQVLDSVSLAYLSLPREENWLKKGIGRDIKQELLEQG